MKKVPGWAGLFLVLALVLAACGGGAGPPAGCPDPAQFDGGCKFDEGAKFGLETSEVRFGRG